MTTGSPDRPESIADMRPVELTVVLWGTVASAILTLVVRWQVRALWSLPPAVEVLVVVGAAIAVAMLVGALAVFFRRSSSVLLLAYVLAVLDALAWGAIGMQGAEEGWEGRHESHGLGGIALILGAIGVLRVGWSVVKLVLCGVAIGTLRTKDVRAWLGRQG